MRRQNIQGVKVRGVTKYHGEDAYIDVFLKPGCWCICRRPKWQAALGRKLDEVKPNLKTMGHSPPSKNQTSQSTPLYFSTLKIKSLDPLPTPMPYHHCRWFQYVCAGDAGSDSLSTITISSGSGLNFGLQVWNLLKVFLSVYATPGFGFPKSL